MLIHTESRAAGKSSQDRLAVFSPSEEVLVFALADGAGGVREGAEAAEAVIRMAQEAASGEIPKASGWCERLSSLDKALLKDPSAGETTAIVLLVSPMGIFGASVGDSVAWLITEETLLDLTAHQLRKPLLGTGEALPMPFFQKRQPGCLLLASDGLWRHAPQEKIRQILKGTEDLAHAARNLLALAALPSGGFADDISLALCRIL